jgi:hypothetical protein
LDWITKDILINDILKNKDLKCEECRISNCVHNAIYAQDSYELVDRKVLYYVGEKRGENGVDIFDPDYSTSLFDPRDSFEFARINIPGENWDELFNKVKWGVVHSPEDTRDYFVSSLLNNPKISPYISYISWGEIWLKDEDGDLSYIENVDEIVRIVKNLYPEKVVL